MALTVQDLFDRVRDITQDLSGVRWSDDELMRWVNDGQRAVANLVPGATAKGQDFDVSAGSRQVLTDDSDFTDAERLLSVVGNAAGDYGPIRLVEREALDNNKPDWRKPVTVSQATGSRGFENYVFDADDPLAFYLYPAPIAAITSAVHVIYSAKPSELSAKTAALSIRDVYANAVIDYMLHRVFAKQATYNARNEGLSQRYFGQFQAVSQLHEVVTDKTGADQAAAQGLM